tara:strand:- start:10 stop:543 length:534 start_codon:yes stop_codon:yes gene_type:complete
MSRNYSNGMIYKICCKDVTIKEVYVGSTINFKNRKNFHKNATVNPNNNDYKLPRYKFIRDNGGWENWDMVLIKKFSCDDKMDLKKEEDKIMREEGATLNSNKAIWNIEEYNKKKYKCSCGVEIFFKGKAKHEKSARHLNGAKKPPSEKVKCDCGSIHSYGHMTRHKKTKKHLAFLKL